jgi:hypothetical protein
MNELPSQTETGLLHRPNAFPAPLPDVQFSGDTDITASDEDAGDTAGPEIDSEATFTGEAALGGLSARETVNAVWEITATEEPDGDAGTDEEPAEPETRPPAAEGPQRPETRSEEGETDTAFAAGDSVNDNPPPELPDTETAPAGEPDRGAALQQLFDYAAVADEQTRETIIAEVTARPDGPRLIDLLSEEDVPPDEAAQIVAFFADGEDNPGDSVHDRVTDSELALAKLQYGEALAATGLTLEARFPEITLCIVEPDKFADALGQLPAPADSQAQEQLQLRSESTIDDALVRASYAVDPTNAAPPEEGLFVTRLAEQAPAIARELQRLGVSETVTDPLRQLALAAGEGLTTQWGIGYGLTVVGHGEEQIGVDRLISSEDWEPVYDYCSYLDITAPDAEFTRDIRDTVLDELDRALGDAEFTPLPLTGDAVFDAGMHIMRYEALEQAEPVLQEARRLIRQIFSPQD